MVEPTPLPKRETPERTEPTLAEMMAICESLDQGLRMAIQVIAELDVRVRKLELATRKTERKLVIANQMPTDATRQ